MTEPKWPFPTGANYPYECHVTISIHDACHVTDLAQDLKWSTSQIDGDPDLGAKPFFYLTTHADLYQEAWSRMTTMADAIKGKGVKVIREKIEKIVWDTKRLENANR